MAHLTTYLDHKSLDIQKSGFDFKANLTSAIGDLANRDILESYVSHLNAMAYDNVLPTGHFESGLGRPTTPIHFASRHGAAVAMDTISNTRHAYKESCQRCLAMGPPANPYTPMQLPRVDMAMSAVVGALGDLGHNCTHSPCLGGPILSPQQQKDRTPGVSRFDIKQLAPPK